MSAAIAETMRFPGSSMLTEASWDPGDQTLSLTFTDGKTFVYSSVPQSTYLGLQRAGSAGQYFHRQIKGRFDYSEA